MVNQTFTITKVVKLASWWQYPWYWVRRKPTKFIEVYEDCKLTSMEFDQDSDGTPIFKCNLIGDRPASEIHISSKLLIPDGSD